MNLKDGRSIDQLLSGPDVLETYMIPAIQVGSSFIITLLINKPPIDLLSKRSDHVKELDLQSPIGFVWELHHTDLLITYYRLFFYFSTL